MIPTLPPAAQYVLGHGLLSLAALGVGVYFLLPRTSGVGLVREFVNGDWRYLGVAWIVTFGVNELARYHSPLMFTDAVLAIEGDAVAVFQSIRSPSLTLALSGVYLVGLPFVVLLTYFRLKDSDVEQARRYALGYVTLVLLATPFFLLFPVRVTGHVLPGVDLLLYDLGPTVRAGIAATDTLVKAFPSLHTGLSVLAALYARKTDTVYKWVVWVLTALIVFSTLYLGVHWLSDLVVALVLVAVAFLVSQRIDDPDRVFFPTR